MEKICANCENWDYGTCTVKYGFSATHSGHRCDEVMIPASDSEDGKAVMFFREYKAEE